MTSDELLARLERLCSKCEYCTFDVRTKAMKSHLPQQEVERIVSSLVSEGYVDDFRYASAFAREKSGLVGWGPVKIHRLLKAKGIDEDVIGMAMREIDSSRAYSKLEKLMESKWRTLEGDPQARLKLIRFALGRGYEYESVSSLVDVITSPRK